MQRSKSIAGVVVGAGVVYFLLMPMLFWPRTQPTVTVDVPSRVAYNQDATVGVRVSSWHANYSIRQVLLYRAYNGSPEPSSDEAQYPLTLYESEPTTEKWSINPFTWPRSTAISVTLPLEQLARENKVVQGKQHWKLDVLVDYITGLHRRGYVRGQMPVPLRVSFPVELQLE